MAMVFGAFGAAACDEAGTTGPAKAAFGPGPTLPARANAPLEIEGNRPGAMRVRVAWTGALGASARQVGERLVYPNALGEGFDLEREARGDTVEDWVRLPRAPRDRALRLTFSTAGVAGLRLVAGTLELLDARGTPRVRMSPPWARDRRGEVHTVRVDVEGCAVSRDPRPPWGKPLVAPGAAACDVVLGLDLSDDAYPAVLDPLWGRTGSLAVPRAQHTATRLPNGHVLVAGGYDDVARRDTASAELYDPASGTFAATEPMSIPRRSATAVDLVGGSVAVIGGELGLGPPTVLASTERYDPTTGRWSAGTTLAIGRSGPTVTRLRTGEVIVVGGLRYDAAGASVTDVDRCTADLLGCRMSRALPEPRAAHGASLLSDGRVLVTGGGARVFESAQSLYATSTIYDPTSETWSDGPPLPAPRFGHVAVTGANGQVLLVGGALAPQGESIASDVLALDAGTTRFVVSGRLTTPRWLHSATSLPSGKVLVTGSAVLGYQLGSATSAELFDPSTGTSREVGTLHRTYFGAHALLPNDQVLVVGGGKSIDSASAYLFADDPPDAGPRDAGPDASSDASSEPLDATPAPRPDAAPGDAAGDEEARGFYACSSSFPERESRIAPLVLAAAVAASAARRRRR
ncbi:MAG: hypothetical protein IPK71_13885 [Myxococcales bacterium]|nr:hypothetical protein [Myxococcales bacterium]